MKEMKEINGMEAERYMACEILEIFEDFLASKGIQIPNKERDEYADGDLEGLAILFGSDFYSLENRITETIKRIEGKQNDNE
jgi:hypothetical protein